MQKDVVLKSVIWGLAASSLLLAIYFSIVSLISGFEFAQDQFRQFWYFVVSLAAGFGIQIGLYIYLRRIIKHHNMTGIGKTVAVTGATSTLAMISCCAHYLANIIPILGIAGFLTVVAQYQVQFFWAGLAFNLFGIIYVGRKIILFRQQV